MAVQTFHRFVIRRLPLPGATLPPIMGLRTIILASILMAAAFGIANAQDVSGGHANGVSGEALVSPAPSAADAAATAPAPGNAGAVTMTPIAALTTATPVVVELFTSEGCASCTPADANLGSLTHERSVLPLSYHVDYWDYIGWRDRHADPAFTARQHGYVDALGHSMVYTPQMIVAGSADSLGTDVESVKIAVDNRRQTAEMTPIRFLRDPAGNVVLDLPATTLPTPATVWLVTYRRKIETAVQAGENAGKRLVSYNVVQSLKKLGTWTGAASSLLVDLDPPPAGDPPPDGVAVIANLKEYGPVVAATAVAFKDIK